MHAGFELIFTILACSTLLVSVSLYFTRFLRVSKPTEEKLKVYECGEDSQGVAAHIVHSRFYRIAIVFLVFDVEVIFIYPIAVLFKRVIDSDMAMVAFAELVAFVFILGIGFVYAWKKGALSWDTDHKTFF